MTRRDKAILRRYTTEFLIGLNLTATNFGGVKACETLHRVLVAAAVNYVINH